MPSTVTLSDQQQADLRGLSGLNESLFKEFLRIAVDFIKKGCRRGLFGPAAQRIGMQPEQVQRGVEALSSVLTECARCNLSEQEFAEGLLDQQLRSLLPKEQLVLMRKVYAHQRAEIRAVLNELSFSPLPHYVDLRWRLDAVVATRSMRQQVTEQQPLYILNLETAGGAAAASAAPTVADAEQAPATQTVVLQADPLTLQNMCAQLESAIAELKSPTTRRVMRNIR
eukprot:TRINITY_DN5951_c0_g1_i1.p1 TRINITY_DN5951_c0_g1~~TRINITY_DN5951_c0_g1_i1.p1  ORF type:complete len:246 (-),score=84.77 TRINITY_DN5951_c0_g1_i1:159-836(-)